MVEKSELGVPQSLKDACRWVCFETPYEGWEVATNGGTLFLVIYGGVPYGITAKHNRHSFRWDDLIVGRRRAGQEIVGIKSVAYANTGLGRAANSDLLDVALIMFADDATPAYFEGLIYDLDNQPVCVSRPDDDLVIYGALSESSQIGDKEILQTFGELGFIDMGPNGFDIVLRQAKGQWLNSRVCSLAGLSGAPVYNTTQGGLCGMMLRGGLNAIGIASALYIDISDIVLLLDTVHKGQSVAFYTKIVAHLVRDDAKNSCA